MASKISPNQDYQMYSFSWQFIESNRLGIPKHISYLILVISSIIFAFPRFFEGWFFYAAVAYPISMIVMLQLIKQIHRLIMQMLSYKLLEEKKGNEKLNKWWENNTLNKIHFLSCFLGATFLAIASLFFNANPNWTRYTDAIAIFYLGFVASEIAYLLTLIPFWLSELKRFQLRLNPIDPANTANLRALAQTVFNVALATGVSLFLLNIVIAVSSYLFPHLRSGVIFISVVAWISVIILAGFPHLTFAQIVEARKQATLKSLEKKLIEKYNDIVDTNEASSSSIEEIMKIHKLVLGSNSYPISGSSYIGVTVTLFLNSLPIIIEFIR